MRNIPKTFLLKRHSYKGVCELQTDAVHGVWIEDHVWTISEPIA
jgi:hypothetical protein